jgi:hypothetical protein
MAPKAELQAGKMKFVKPFSKTCYSENLIMDSSLVREGGSLIDSGEKGGKETRPCFTVDRS